MLDKDELIYTKILNHKASVKEIIKYIDGLHEDISHLSKERDLFHRVMENSKKESDEIYDRLDIQGIQDFTIFEISNEYKFKRKLNTIILALKQLDNQIKGE